MDRRKDADFEMLGDAIVPGAQSVAEADRKYDRPLGGALPNQVIGDFLVGVDVREKCAEKGSLQKARIFERFADAKRRYP